MINNTVYDNIVNVLQPHDIQQSGDTCTISLLDVKSELNNAVFNFDLDIDVQDYQCTNINIIPLQTITDRIENVLLTGKISLKNYGDKSIQLVYFSNGNVDANQVLNVNNNIKVNDIIIAQENQNTVITVGNQTNAEFYTIQKSAIESVTGNGLTNRSVTLAYCQKYQQLETYDLYQTTKQILKSSIEQEFNNVNEFRYIFYGGKVEAVQEIVNQANNDVQQKIVQNSEIQINDIYVISIGNVHAVKQFDKWQICQGVLNISGNNLCAGNYCKDDLVDDTFCIALSEEDKQNYHLYNGKYYSKQYTYIEISGDQCENDKYLLQSKFCIEQCPENYIQNTETKTCDVPSGKKYFKNVNFQGIEELTQSCSLFDIITSRCISRSECQVTDAKQQFRYCEAAGADCKYSISSDFDPACNDDCGIFDVEIDQLTDTDTVNHLCRPSCDSDVQIQFEQICLPCFGYQNERKVLTNETEKQCVAIENYNTLYYNLEEFDGIKLLVKYQNQCPNAAMRYIMAEDENNYCIEGLCVNTTNYQFQYNGSNKCVKSCGTESDPLIWKLEENGEKYCLGIEYCEGRYNLIGYNKRLPNNQCSNSCPYDYFYISHYAYDGYNEYTCSTENKCPSEYPALIISNNQKECIEQSQCLNELHILVNLEEGQQCQTFRGTNSCKQFNNGNKYYKLDTSTEDSRLYILHTCSGDTPFIKYNEDQSEEKTCVASCGISQDGDIEQPYVWYINSDLEQQCTQFTQCSQDIDHQYIAENGNNQCIDQCQSFEIQDEPKRCVSQCTGEYAIPELSTDKIICDYSCQFYQTADQKHCISACNDNYPIQITHESQRKECVTSCKLVNENWFRQDNTCVELCSNFKDLTDSDNLCLIECSEDKYGYEYDTNDKRCTITCNDAMKKDPQSDTEFIPLPYLYNNMCVEKCTEQQLWDNDKMCYDGTECPHDRLLLLDTRECIYDETCPEGYLPVENQKQCSVNNCIDKEFISADGSGRCVENCIVEDVQHVWILTDDGQKQCKNETKCPQFDGNSDIKQIIMSEEYQCINSCSGYNYFYSIITNKTVEGEQVKELNETVCKTSCNNMYYFEHDDHIIECFDNCVYQYSQSSDLDNKQCQTKCKPEYANYYAFQTKQGMAIQCMDQQTCPEKYPFKISYVLDPNYSQYPTQCSSTCEDGIDGQYRYKLFTSLKTMQQLGCVVSCEDEVAFKIIYQSQQQVCFQSRKCTDANKFGNGTEFIETKENVCEEKNIQCNSSTYYIEENEQSRCELTCPFFSYYSESINQNICINVTDCSQIKSSPYQYMDTNKCVDNCTKYNLMSMESKCVSKCEGDYAIYYVSQSEKTCNNTCNFMIVKSDAGQRLCQSEEECQQKAQVLISENRYQCELSCSNIIIPEFKLKYKDQCVSNCPKDYFNDYNNYKCTEECQYRFYSEDDKNICTYKCPSDQQYILYISDNKMQQCVAKSECPNQSVLGNICLRSKDGSISKQGKTDISLIVVGVVLIIVIVTIVTIISVKKCKQKKQAQNRDVELKNNHENVIQDN